MKVIYTRNEGTVWIPNWRYTYLRNNPIIHECCLPGSPLCGSPPLCYE